MCFLNAHWRVQNIHPPWSPIWNIWEEKKENPGDSLSRDFSSPELFRQSAFFFPSFRVILSISIKLFSQSSYIERRRAGKVNLCHLFSGTEISAFLWCLIIMREWGLNYFIKCMMLPYWEPYWSKILKVNICTLSFFSPFKFNSIIVKRIRYLFDYYFFLMKYQLSAMRNHTYCVY